ncbi:hypothetical protein GN956_G8178 [Arapaima gigas]
MALLNYPLPELETSLQEASRVLQVILSPEEFLNYKNALCQQSEVLLDAHRNMAVAASGCENWVTTQFKNHILSCADPLPVSTAIPMVLPPTAAPRVADVQLERAAALLWAAAKVHAEPWLVEGDEPTERTQQSEVFATSRLPGKTQDEIQVYPYSVHAILVCARGIFPVQILCCHSPGGTLSPLPIFDIYRQLAEVVCQPVASLDQDPAIICSFTALNRRAWHGLRECILSSGRDGAASLKLMESAVLAISLEDCCAPPDLAKTLNIVRLGRGDRCCLRYYDKVVNIAVFQDGTAGIVFEHSALDGMVAGLVTRSIWRESESLSFSLTQSLIKSSGSSANLYPVKPLNFPLDDIAKFDQPVLSYSTTDPSTLITFEIQSHPDIFTALRSQRGLFDAWVNFSLQLALKQTLGDSVKNHIFVTPTHMRHYKHGRCDPTYPITTESRHLVETLMSCTATNNTLECSRSLFRLFHLAFVEHKRLIKATKKGQGVGPHLAALRKALALESPLKQFFDHFIAPSVYITGKDIIEGVDCAVGNVYAPDQLAVTYLGGRDRVRLIFNGNGSFANILNLLQENLQGTLKLMMFFALRYAIAGQMGAIQCLVESEKNDEFAEGETPGLVSSQDANTQKGKTSETSEKKNANFTLIIHGGVMEEINLDRMFRDIIEFSLHAALYLGAQELSKGGLSLNAVQKCIAALEDCFLFSAGKGGLQEMEATIVDGKRMNFGSVALVQSVKNPIKAARQVMEKNPHTLLAGDEVMNILEKEQDKSVNAGSFQSNIWKKSATKGSEDNFSQYNYPKTVGAVALDGWGNLAAATSTGAWVGKSKGQIGGTAVMGAGIFADETVAVTCSGNGDVLLKLTVAHKVACLYHYKDCSIRKCCQKIVFEDLKGSSIGIIAVDNKGEAVIESNARVMFVGSVINGVERVEILEG